MTRSRRRLGLFLFTTLAHGVLLAWMGLQAPRPLAGLGEGRGISVGLFDGSVLAGERESAEPSEAAPEPSPPAAELATALEEAVSETVEPSLPEWVDPIEFAEATPVNFTSDPQPVGAPPAGAPAVADAGGGQGACALEARLQGVLQADPAVRTAVAAIPRDTRSVSNAVMMWNGRWMSLGKDGASIRTAVHAFITAAPRRCQEEAISGPSLVPIEGEGKPTILVVGSGLWRWSDLLQAGTDPRR